MKYHIFKIPLDFKNYVLDKKKLSKIVTYKRLKCRLITFPVQNNLIFIMKMSITLSGEKNETEVQ